METHSQVLTAEVNYEGQTYAASYFVQRDIIQAIIAGRIMLTPLTDEPAEETVRTLLLESVQHQEDAESSPE